MAKKYTEKEITSIAEQFEELVEGRDTYFLVVDKQIALRRTVMQALLKMGVQKEFILEAGDGIDAQMRFSEADGKVVLVTDLQLPGSDGLQLIKQFRDDPAHAEDPVIVVSGEKRKERIVLAVKLGVDAYLKKPLDPDVFVAKVGELGLVETPE